MIDSRPKNIGAYALFFALAILVGGLESVHVQYQATRTVDPFETADAVIAYVLPTLTMMLLAMKLPSIGSEKIADRVQDVRESLQVETPAEHRAEVAMAQERPAVQAPRARPRPMPATDLETT